MVTELLLLLLLTTTTTNTLISAPISPIPIPDTPFGTRLFLTSLPNHLNLVWTCNVRKDQTTSSFASATKIEVFYNRNTAHNKPAIVRTADRTTGNVTSHFKQDGDNQFLIGNFNTTVELLFNQTLSYRVFCESRASDFFQVDYKYWDAGRSKEEPWVMLTVGSLGLFNTTNITLRTIKKVSRNNKNVLWAIPGGIVADHTVDDNETKPIKEEVSWRQWITWLLMTSYVTCCIPLVASPSELDLYPYSDVNTTASNYRHFLELPFDSQEHEVLWYSFNHRNLHVVSICSYCDLSENSTQHLWLEADLAAAAANPKTHWIMAMGHEPIYDPQQSLHSNKLIAAREQLDKMFHKYKVDFAVWSHERWYARSKPMINGQVSDTRVSNSLTMVNGTVHYTCGTGGTPLQNYNMDKYNHTAYYDYRYYGVCVFERIQDDYYESMFIHHDAQEELVFNDMLKFSKKIVKPPVNIENHFGKFMKVFGIVIVGGAVFMLLVIGLLKFIQSRDPSYIASKIRQVTTSNIRFGGRSQNAQDIHMSCDEIDAVDFQDERDTVMLLEEEKPAEDKFNVEAAITYR